MTLRQIISLPVMQLFLFGYAINTDPKHFRPGFWRPSIRNMCARLAIRLRSRANSRPPSRSAVRGFPSP
jgi:hypothetical protein